MASNGGSLTATLPGEDRGKSVIAAPNSVGPYNSGFIEGLSRFGSGFADALSSQSNQKWQQYNENYTKAERGAVNDTIGAVIPELEKQNDKLKTVQSAEDQGKIPAGSTAVHLDSTLNTLLAAHPENRDAVLSTFGKYGWDHYLIREVQLNQKAADKQFDDDMAAKESYRQAAVHAGLYDPSKSDDENMQQGRDYTHSEAVLASTRAKLELTRTNLEITDLQRKQVQTQGDRDGINAILSQSQQFYIPMLDKMGMFIQSAGSDAELEKRIQDSAPLLNSAINTWENQAVAKARGAGLSEDAITQIHAEFAKHKAQLNDYFSGDASIFKMHQQARTNLENNFGISAMNSVPLLYKLKDIFGPNAIQEFAAGNPLASLSPEIQKGIKAEMLGLSNDDVSQSAVHMNNIKRILGGDLEHFHSLTPQEIPSVVQGAAAALSGDHRAIANGDKSPTTIAHWTSSYGTIVNAAADVTPNTADLKTLQAATDQLTNPVARTAMKIGTSNSTTADAVKGTAVASRGAATNLFMVVKTKLPDTDPERFQSVQYDPKKGEYVIFFDQKAWQANQGKPKPNTYMSDIEQLPFPQDNSLAAASKASPQLAAKRDMLNKLLTHISDTTQYTDNAPTGVTPLQIKNHFADPAKYPLQTPKGENAKTPQQANLDNYDNFIKGVQGESLNSAVETATDMGKIRPSSASQFFQSKGWSPQASAGIVGNLMTESQLNPNSTAKDGSGSEGIAQWRAERLVALKKFAEDNKGNYRDPNIQLEFIDHELRTTHSSAAEALKNAKTVEEATQAFALLFEKPKGSETGDFNKVIGAADRLNHARAIHTYG